MKHLSSTLLIIFIIILLNAKITYSQTLEIYPSDDVQVNTYTWDEVHQTLGFRINRVGRCITEGYDYERTAIKFSLSEIEGTSFSSATLNFFVDMINGNPTFSLIASGDDDWSEMTSSSFPDYDLANVIYPYLYYDVNSYGWHSFDVTAFVDEQFAGDKNVTFVLIGDEGWDINDTEFGIATRENPINQPYLYIEGILPVELTSFTGIADNKNIKLLWSTATEVNNYGFQIERSLVNGHQSFANQNNPLVPSGNSAIQNPQWEVVGFVEGNGNSNSPKQYSFVDACPFGEKPISGKVKYRLKQIDSDGEFEYSHEIEVSYMSSLKFGLSQNTPNPCNPSSKINYSIPENAYVTLKIYDLLGKEVATLVDEVKEGGFYEAEFNGNDLSSGVYIYRLSAGKYNSTKKMILLR